MAHDLEVHTQRPDTSAEDYDLVRQIGSGSFGDVFLVVHKGEQKQYVMKTITLVATMQTKQRENLESEVKLLSTMQHPNIVAYKGSVMREGNLYIYMEYCEHGDVYTYLRDAKKLNKMPQEHRVFEWFIQITLALQAVHQKRILHRDMKTQNIFLTGSRVQNVFALKLGDFGVAKALDCTTDLAQTQIGTPFYMSPELINNKPYSYKSDIWGLGCILYEIVNGHQAFEAQSLNGLALKIMKGRYTPVTANCSEAAKELIKSMLTTNPGHRPSLENILHNPQMRNRILVATKSVIEHGAAEGRSEAERVLTEQLKALGFGDLDQAGAGPKRDKRRLLHRMQKAELRKQQAEQKLNKLMQTVDVLEECLRGQMATEAGIDPEDAALSQRRAAAARGRRPSRDMRTPPKPPQPPPPPEAQVEQTLMPDAGTVAAVHNAANAAAAAARQSHVVILEQDEGDLAGERPAARSAVGRRRAKTEDPCSMHRGSVLEPVSRITDLGTSRSSTQHSFGTPRYREAATPPRELSVLLDFDHVTSANLRNPFKSQRANVVHTPRRQRSVDPRPPLPQCEPSPPHDGPPPRTWSQVQLRQSTPHLHTSRAALNNVSLEALSTAQNLREPSESSSGSGTHSEGGFSEFDRRSGSAEHIARRKEQVQSRMEYYKASICRHRMQMETLQHKYAQEQSREDVRERNDRAATFVEEGARAEQPPTRQRRAMPVVVEDQLARIVRRCLDGLGHERLAAAKRCLHVLTDGGEEAFNMRRHMRQTLGEDKIGFYSLIDQIVYIERHWGEEDLT